MSPTIRPATSNDAAALCALYNHYVSNDTCTFEINPISNEEMARRITERSEKYGFLLCEEDCTSGAPTVCGFAYYGRFRDRAAYDHVVETSIYLAPQQQGKGLGKHLYQALLDHATAKGFREAIAVLAVPNEASQCLHEKLGYQHCGSLSACGFKFQRYIDTAYYQRRL